MNTHNLVLRPNCLLTRYPVVFINPPRSLFWYEKLGGWYQDHLTEHGYQVICPTLPFRNRNLRSKSLEAWLEQQNIKRFHFVLAKNTFEEFKPLFIKLNECTFTFSDNFTLSTKNTQPAQLSYLFHKWFCCVYSVKIPDYSALFPHKNQMEFERLLDRCIELAENDHI